MSAQLDLCVDQGASLQLALTYEIDGSPVDLTGYTAEMKIGSDPYATPGTDYLTVTQANHITLGGAAGTIDVLIPPATTAAFTWCDAFYQLDIQSPAGLRTRLLRGTIVVVPIVP